MKKKDFTSSSLHPHQAQFYTLQHFMKLRVSSTNSTISSFSLENLKGGMYLPRSDSGRIIIGTWWLVVLVVVTTYCGNLVAFLTFPKMEIPVNSIGQLVSGKYPFTWSIRSNTFLDTFLKVGIGNLTPPSIHDLPIVLNLLKL